MIAPDKEKENLPEKEIAKRRDETLKRMLKTPPKPHSEIVGGGEDVTRKRKSTKPGEAKS